LGANIAENADHEIEAVVAQSLQVAGVAFLEAEVGEPEVAGALVARRDEIAGDVDAQHVSAAFRGRDSGGAVAAAEIQHFEPRRDAQALD
jgi:hypothetical protein